MTLWSQSVRGVTRDDTPMSSSPCDPLMSHCATFCGSHQPLLTVRSWCTAEQRSYRAFQISTGCMAAGCGCRPALLAPRSWPGAVPNSPRACDSTALWARRTTRRDRGWHRSTTNRNRDRRKRSAREIPMSMALRRITPLRSGRDYEQGLTRSECASSTGSVNGFFGSIEHELSERAVPVL